MAPGTPLAESARSAQPKKREEAPLTLRSAPRGGTERQMRPDSPTDSRLVPRNSHLELISLFFSIYFLFHQVPEGRRCVRPRPRTEMLLVRSLARCTSAQSQGRVPENHPTARNLGLRVHLVGLVELGNVSAGLRVRPTETLELYGRAHGNNIVNSIRVIFEIVAATSLRRSLLLQH